MLLALAIAFTGSSSETPSSGSSTTAARVAERSSPAPLLRCRSARLAVSYYRALTYERQDARDGRHATRSPVVRGKACRWARYASEVWRARARRAARRLAAWIEYQYAWEKWLPSNWRALAICETGLNFEHTNGSHTSAFGISWAEYDADAAYNGAPPWHVRHTPRDQYLAALGHYARFGDGWTCPGP